MSLISSAKNLISVSNNLADQVTTVAKGVFCIPSILSNLPSILGAVAGSLIGQITAQATAIAAGLANAALSIVENKLAEITGKITGVITQILALQAAILGTIGMIKGLFKGLQARAKDIQDFVSNEENCKFAAAELLNCVASSLLNDLTSDVVKKINAGTQKVSDYVDNATNKLTKPNEVLTKFSKKAGDAVDKATSQIAAISLF